MFNAYPDSIGTDLTDTMNLLARPELTDSFSMFYVLPTFFHSDLDRGFSVIDYDLNEELVSPDDLDAAREMGIGFKTDLVLNHLSVNSPQFRDLLAKGEESEFREFFIDWNEFWEGHGEMGPEGYVVPDPEHLDLLFMRKPGLPILQVPFPDGTERPYWNTFYQEVNPLPLAPDQLSDVEGVSSEAADEIADLYNRAIRSGITPDEVDFGDWSEHRESVLQVARRHQQYLGQMDLDARSPLVWDFYDETLGKLARYGAELIRLDAFAYLHKQVGERNFFNEPGTWEYLERLREIAVQHGLTVLPEIHATYGSALHRRVADHDFPIYDFFLPGLVIDALDRGTNRHLLQWMRELVSQGLETVNMLGCHDGIPVLDLKGEGDSPGLLTDPQIDDVIDRVLERGGRVKNLFGPDGKKISYYQVNATYFSALGENEQKLRLARAIQMFTPGLPQVWYLDLFAGTNDYEAADRGGTGGHKEINRTTLSIDDVDEGLQRPVVQDQIELVRLRNTSRAFEGSLEIGDGPEHLLHLTWSNDGAVAVLEADLRDHGFTVTVDDDGEHRTLEYPA
jgi:sucrose phosphorylase